MHRRRRRLAHDEQRHDDDADLRRGERGGLRRGGRRAVGSEQSSGSDRASRPRGSRTALGYGVFKSMDGGKTWQHLGLETTEQIGAIVIDPRDPQTVYVGAMGHLWGRNAERGVFKTTDGGRTWRKVLYVDDMTGCIDLGDRSAQPERALRDDVAAPAFGRRRDARVGPGQRHLQEHRRRRALDAPDERAAERAAQQDHAGGRAEDAGPGLRVRAVGRAAARRAHERRRRRLPVRATPARAGGASARSSRRAPTTRTSRSIRRTIGGCSSSISSCGDPTMAASNWVRHNMKNVHDDLHGLWIDPDDPRSPDPRRRRRRSTSRSTTARAGSRRVLPLGQFYDIDVDMQEPYWVYGGMQDTASWSGPSRTYDNDGHHRPRLDQAAIGRRRHGDPSAPARSAMSSTSRRTAATCRASTCARGRGPSCSRPPRWPATLGLHAFRWDWSPPFIVSSPDPERPLCRRATMCSAARSARALPQRRGRAHLHGDQSRSERRSRTSRSRRSARAITATARCSRSRSRRSNAAVLWAGADDGPIHVSRDAGAALDPRRRQPAGGHLQEGFVSKIEPSRKSAGTAYVAYDLHYHDDPKPYLFKTTDFGNTWTTITQRSAGVGLDLRDSRGPAQRARALRRHRVGTVRVDRRRRPLGAMEERRCRTRRCARSSSTPRSRARRRHVRPGDLDRRRVRDRAARRGAAAAGVPLRRQAGRRATTSATPTAPRVEEINGDQFFRAPESAVRHDDHVLPAQNAGPQVR